MKIIAISDIHGFLPELPSCDLLLIVGDICPSPYFPVFESACKHIEWLNSNFRIWLNKRLQNTDKIIAIAGNHDVAYGRTDLRVPELPYCYLEDSSIEYKGLKIYGTPWTSCFMPIAEYPYEWNFCATEEEQVEKFDRIPNGVHILMSHSPPFSICDRTRNNQFVGSKTLVNKLNLLYNLKLHVFGHIHECFGECRIGNIKFANVSYITEDGTIRKNGWLEYEM